MPVPSRATRASLALGLLALAAPACALGPFNVLAWRDGVTTSRSGYAVWLGITSTTHRATIPPHRHETGSDDGHHAALAVRCRTTGGPLPTSFPATAATAELFLQNHPEHRGTYTVAHPMYWILELAGETRENFPITVTIADHPPFETNLVRTLTNYSAPHPGLSIALVPAEVLETIATAQPIDVIGSGPGFVLTARFHPPPEVVRATALIQRHCPVPTRRTITAATKEAQNSVGSK